MDDPLCGDVERLRWESRGVGLDWGPWDVGEANEPTPRPNPSNGNTSTHKYHQTPLEGKRDLYMAAGILLIIGIFINIATLISYALMYLALGKTIKRYSTPKQQT